MIQEQINYVECVNRWIDSMTLEQMKAVRAHLDDAFERELKLAAEGMVAAFDGRPEGEPASITQTTQAAALNTAKQILGWQS